MKSTFKRILSAVVVLALLAASMLALASCGDKTFADGTIKIGATGPLTGDNASYGISVQNGAKLAIKHLNEKEGIKFSFAILDDKAGAEDASTNYDTLYDAGMQISLGGVTSGSGEAFAKKANVDKVFCMTPSGSADPVIKDMAYSYRLCFGDPDQGTVAAEAIKAGVANGTYTSVGALYDNSDSYSSGIYEAFKTAMTGTAYTEASFDQDNKTDFTTQAEKLKDCDIIFMPFYYTEAQTFIKQTVAKGSDAIFFGCDGFDGIASYITDVENTVMYITPFDAASEKQNVKDFVAAYEAEYGKTPDQFAADAYDVVMVLADAIAKAGVTDVNISAEELANKVIAVITAADYSYSGLTGDMKWAVTGECTKAPNIVVFD